MKTVTQASTEALTVGEWLVEPMRTRISHLYEQACCRSVQPLSMDILVHLASQAGSVVSTADLLDLFWPDRYVGSDAVHRRIADLRSTLDDDSTNPRYIETIRKRGYRLIAEVRQPSSVRAQGRYRHRSSPISGEVSSAFCSFTGTSVMPIPSYSADTPTEKIADGLSKAGCAVVTGLMDPELRQSITNELAPHMAQARVIDADDPEEFYPGRTRRITALVNRSTSITDRLIGHPISADVCQRFLIPNSEFGYQLHVTAALEVGPGAREQVLHREEDSFTYFPVPRPNLIVASMWAISDFRADNGATLLVPGSHTWPEDRVATADEIVQAEMPAGSVLFWLGGLLHGAGANVSQDWRYGVILTYSAGWVRQEENQYLNVTPERLAELSPEIRQIIGFDMYRALGFYDPSVS